MIEEVLGVKFQAIAAGLSGAVVSLAFIKGLTPMVGIITVLGGAACAAYIAPSIVEYYSLTGKAANVVPFGVGLFGMNLMGGVFSLVARFRDNPLETIKNIKNLGDDK